MHSYIYTALQSAKGLGKLEAIKWLNSLYNSTKCSTNKNVIVAEMNDVVADLKNDGLYPNADYISKLIKSSFPAVAEPSPIVAPSTDIDFINSDSLNLLELLQYLFIDNTQSLLRLNVKDTFTFELRLGGVRHLFDFENSLLFNSSTPNHPPHCWKIIDVNGTAYLDLNLQEYLVRGKINSVSPQLHQWLGNKIMICKI